MYLASGLALRSSSLAVRRGGAMSRPAARHLCMAAAVKGMSAKDFAGIIASPDARRLYQIIDVREKDELAAASIKGGDIVSLPLSEADVWGPKVEAGQLLDKSLPTICLCKAGGRSQKMADFLAGRAAFQEVYNMQGGIFQGELAPFLDSSKP